MQTESGGVPASIFIHFQRCFSHNIGQFDQDNTSSMFQFLMQLCEYDVTDYVCKNICQNVLGDVKANLKADTADSGVGGDDDALNLDHDDDDDDSEGQGGKRGGQGGKAGGQKKKKQRGKGDEGGIPNAPPVGGIPNVPPVNPNGDLKEELKKLTDYIAELKRLLVDCRAENIRLKQGLVSNDPAQREVDWSILIKQSELSQENSKLRIQQKELMNHIQKLLTTTTQLGHVDIVRSVRNVTGAECRTQGFGAFLTRFKKEYGENRPNFDQALKTLADAKQGFKQTMLVQQRQQQQPAAFASYYY